MTFVMNVLNYQGLQNDMRNINRKKFDLKSSVEDILHELNNGNDNKVILW